MNDASKRFLRMPAMLLIAGVLVASPAFAQFGDDGSILGEGLQEEEGFEEDNWLNDSFGNYPGGYRDYGDTGFGGDEEGEGEGEETFGGFEEGEEEAESD